MKNILKPILVIVICIAAGFDNCAAESKAEDADKLLQSLVAKKWGKENIVLPSSKVLVQYERDLGERWIVDFERGDVTLECLWTPETSLDDPDVVTDMICAVSNLYVSTPMLPQLMLNKQIEDGIIPAAVANPREIEYKIKKGDTLSEISESLRVPVKNIMLVNGITNPHKIRIGQVLTIPAAPPHMHVAGETHERAEESILKGQLVNPENGDNITEESVGALGIHLVSNNEIESELIRGEDGKPRKLTRIKLTLKKNHLQIRARNFYPMVREHAERFGHDPALIMAIVHTESAFNPQASSSANAYGLMQVVPSSGGREAYRWLHRKDIKPSPSYLLIPRQNLELGTAYMKILKDRTFADVKNPESRLYCAVAAYNGGGGNVGRAFIGRKSVQASVDTINAQSPDQVRRRLERNAPYKETREYVKKVLDRMALYRTPQWQQ